MARYVIKLHGRDGEVVSEDAHDLDDDIAAIDYASDLDYPHEINVWEGHRLVVRFAPRQSP